MRWPAAWKSPAALEILRGTPVDCLFVADPSLAAALAAALARPARQAAIEVVPHDKVPAGVAILEGIWPGIRLARFGSSNSFSAGPTGDPWVNSNIWPVRLARARNPGASVWIRATPANRQFDIAIADAAIAGGRWIVTLDDPLAADLLARKPQALAAWKSITSTAAYFAARRAWTDYEAQAILGVVSDFKTSESEEVLNLITRSGQQYRPIPLDRFDASALSGLRAVVYPDDAAPPAAVRAGLTAFVDRGGLLIAGKAWNAPDGATPAGRTHPRFNLLSLGKGTVALARTDLSDPYQLAADTAILVSHRYDLLRFWNGGAMSAYYSATPHRKRALVQILFYANRPPEDASVRIAGDYTTARLSTFESPQPRPVRAEPQPGAIEVYLPPVARFAAIELE